MIAKQYWLFLLVILGVFHLNITAQNVSNSSFEAETPLCA
jgi:hypothetical protein